jgi:tetratricopeptide (TPR) repeat protein
VNDSSVDEGARGTRLDSWKAIAQHLGRSPRTAQRWHAEFGLPVNHLGGDCGSVFAYSDEIDDWFRKQRANPSIEKPGKPSLVQVPAKRIDDGLGAQGQMLAFVESSGGSRSRKLTADAQKMWTLVTAGNLHTIARLFRKAIDLDPGNAESYAGLSHALIAQGIIGNISLGTAYPAAQAAVEKALEIDPGLNEAICAKALLDVVCHRNWESAGILFERILMDGIVTTRAMVGRALLSIAERDCENASDLLYRASQQDSLSSLSLGFHTWSEYLAGSYAEVLDHIAQARESGCFGPIIGAVEALTFVQCLPRHEAIDCIGNLIVENPGNCVARGALRYLLGLDGNEEHVRRMLELLKSRRSHANVTTHFAIALIHLGLDETEEAIRSIKRSYQAGSLWSLGFHSDPVLRSLEKEGEFKHFLSTSYPVVRCRAESLTVPFNSKDDRLTAESTSGT